MSIQPSHFTAHSTGRAHTHVLESNVDAIAPKFMARFHSCELTKAYQAHSLATTKSPEQSYWLNFFNSLGIL